MKTHRLWETDAPGALGKSEQDIPVLVEYSETKSGAGQPSVVVCPGGGYGGLADHEGKPIAEYLESIGVKAFVLHYRLGPKYHHPVMLNDVNRAIRFVRCHGDALGIDDKKIGVLGFSAGGHLASTAVTYFDSGHPENTDLVERFSSRPDVGILIYPVITMGPLGHAGSRENLLGKNPTDRQISALSSEQNVSLQTPPCFIVHGVDDAVVPIQNALLFAQALAEHKVPFQLQAPEHGQHGFGLGAVGTLQDWRQTCADWLRLHHF